MSQEAAPERALPEQPVAPVQQSAPTAQSAASVPEQGGGAPKGLLQQMEELMAALTADLSQLDADLQSSADRQASTADPAAGAVEPAGPTDHRGGSLA
ncbi:hypothetical protein ACFU3J_03975 [Streptomyces sp. NPDC057411]|uniref:hypothetical protein n=1 Tax=unclassified Streptomyces TaxID=2593676 RepID=UPI0036364AEE